MRQPRQVIVLPFRIAATGPEYAVFRRADDGCWQGVAGGAEGDEDLVMAARREAIEESGLASGPLYALDMVSGVARIWFAASRQWPADLYIVTKHFFAMDVSGETAPVILSREHSEFRWAPHDDASEILRYDDDKTALWELDTRIRAGGLPPAIG